MNTFVFSTPKHGDPGYAKADKLGHEALTRLMENLKNIPLKKENKSWK